MRPPSRPKDEYRNAEHEGSPLEPATDRQTENPSAEYGGMSPSADLSTLPRLPQDDSGPSFREPWEAHAFAMALLLHEHGLYSWPEWAAALAAQIDAAQHDGDADLGDTYYRHWLAALETLVAAKGAGSAVELTRLRLAWGHAADRTPHGRPLELRATDFGETHPFGEAQP